MPNSLYFCDSNIWLYRFLFDPDGDGAEEIKKHDIATNMTNAENILVSNQFINEVCAVLLRKAKVSSVGCAAAHLTFSIAKAITTNSFVSHKQFIR